MTEPLRREEESTQGNQLKLVQPPGESAVPAKAHASPITSLILGLLGLVLWLIPLFGLPVTITGFVKGFNAYKREPSALALVGMLLCVAGMAACVANAIFGAYLGATGQHELINQFRSGQ